MCVIEQETPGVRLPIIEAGGPPPVQSCLFGHSRAEVVYDCS